MVVNEVRGGSGFPKALGFTGTKTAEKRRCGQDEAESKLKCHLVPMQRISLALSF